MLHWLLVFEIPHLKSSKYGQCRKMMWKISHAIFANVKGTIKTTKMLIVILCAYGIIFFPQNFKKHIVNYDTKFSKCAGFIVWEK